MNTRSQLLIAGAALALAAVVIWAFARPVVDTERDLVPDAIGRTNFRINNLREAIAQYVQQNEELPRSLEVVLPSTPVSDAEENPRNDAWGRPIVLELAEGGYRLRSAGPDGKHGSDDDLSLEVAGADIGR